MGGGGTGFIRIWMRKWGGRRGPGVDEEDMPILQSMERMQWGP
jgi:hypothetical protein